MLCVIFVIGVICVRIGILVIVVIHVIFATRVVFVICVI